MMFESNYDNRLPAPCYGAKAGAANGKQIIVKHDSKFKKTGKNKRRATTLDPLFLELKAVPRLPKWLPKWSRYFTGKAIPNVIINEYRFVSLREAIFWFLFDDKTDLK